ncbi:MAG: PIN domain-containing protein [Desulfobacterales bacterium]
MSIFIDTSGFIAVLDIDDLNHTRAAETWQNILTSSETLVTTNYVLVETFALVQSRLGMAAVRVFQEDIVPVLRIEWINDAMHHAAMVIMLAALRKKLSLVDCVSFETMRLLGVKTAFTLDRHFKEQGFICLPA